MIKSKRAGRSKRATAAVETPPNKPPSIGSELKQVSQILSLHPGPRGFNERELQQKIHDLLAEKDVDRATRLLIDNLPDIHTSKLNVKEKLSNILFLARAIQLAGGAKYGANKLQNKIRGLNQHLSVAALPAGGFVELGCGAHDPIGLSSYFYLNGFSPCYSIDLLPPRVSYFSALSMYEIFANVKMFPGRYARKGVKPLEILENLRKINVAAFERGDFEAGMDSMAPHVRFYERDLLQCDIAPSTIALLTSFAVLEHVDDIDAITRRIFDLVAPGGYVYHFVDLADHRSYRGDGEFGPLTFLSEEQAPANMNRLRAPEIVEAHLKAGFEVVTEKRVGVPIPPEIEENLMPRLKGMPREDIATIKQHLVLRKPL